MSKIQDVIRRLSTNKPFTASLTNLLRIPAQQDHGSSPLPIEAADLKTWLIAQGFANKGFPNNGNTNQESYNSAKSLMRALQHSNRTTCAPVPRLLIMEEYEKPFAVAMQALDTQYLYFDFPLHTNAEKSFQLAVTLCQEMAYGYKIALADSAKNNGIFRKEKLGKEKKILAIKNAMEHLSQMALRHSQVYRDWPAECWRDINTLARIAMHAGVAESTVNTGKKATANSLSVKTTIRNQYARLCALHIMDQKHYQPEQLRALFSQLTTHANEVVFHHTPQARTGYQTTNLVNIQSGNQYSVGDDNPPVLSEFRYQKEKSSALLYFSLDALLSKIDSIEENNEASSIHRHCNRSRADSRSPRSGMITAANGLKEIHTLIKMTPPSEETDSQFTDIEQLLQLNTAHLPPVQSDTLNSINTTDFGTAFEVENESRNGFGLRWAGTTSCKLQNGELLAHCYRGKNNDTSWHLAVVRWLNTSADNSLRLGVESISRHVTAVDVVRLIKGEQQTKSPVEALLINYLPIDSKAKMLILPMHKYRAGETVGYRDQNGFQMVKLIEKVNLAGNFQGFAISLIEQSVSPSGTPDVVDIEANNRPVYQAAI